MANIRFFKTLVAIAKHGSFGSAAERIGLTQAAVSLQMNALEKDLQHALFDRSGRVAKLNGFGKKILPQAEQLLSLYDELRTASVDADEVTGTIQVGALISMMGQLSTIVAQLKRIHPRLKVHLSTGKSNELNARVDAGELDFAITVQSPSSSKASLRWTPLHQEPLIMLAGRGAHSRKADDLLKTEPFLRFDRAQQTGMFVSRAIQQLGIKPKEFLEVNSLEAIVELVRQGAGVTILPQVKNASWRSDPALRVIPLPRTTIKRTIGILERKQHERSDIINIIRQYLVDAAGADSARQSARQ